LTVPCSAASLKDLVGDVCTFEEEEAFAIVECCDEADDVEMCSIVKRALQLEDVRSPVGDRKAISDGFAFSNQRARFDVDDVNLTESVGLR